MDKKIFPYRIKQARISRGYSMSELGDLVGVSRQAISQYELGTYPPSISVLYKIANILHYSISFFQKEPPVDAASSSAVFFRSRRTTTKKAKAASIEKISIFQEIDNYLRNFVTFPDVNIPTLSYNFKETCISNEVIESLADFVRKYWELGNGPIANLTSVFQRNGIMISVMNLNNKKIDAFSVIKNKIPYIFLSNDKYSNARLRFTLAHELGHLLLHANYYSFDDDISFKVVNEKLEYEADYFAACFLLPAETFSKDIYSTSINHFINLKKKWNVSIGAMIYRCENLDILTENQIKYLKDQMSYNRFWKNEPLDSVLPLEKPFAHRQAFDLILEHHLATPFDIIESIGCYSDEIEEYSFLEPGTLSVHEAPNNIIQLKI